MYSNGNGKYAGGGCHVFNENGTLKGNQDITFVSHQMKTDELVVIFQSAKEFKSRKKSIYFTQFKRYMRLKRGKYYISLK